MAKLIRVLVPIFLRKLWIQSQNAGGSEWLLWFSFRYPSRTLDFCILSLNTNCRWKLALRRALSCWTVFSMETMSMPLDISILMIWIIFHDSLWFQKYNIALQFSVEAFHSYYDTFSRKRQFPSCLLVPNAWSWTRQFRTFWIEQKINWLLLLSLRCIRLLGTPG